jgi:NTE family protein
MTIREGDGRPVRDGGGPSRVAIACQGGGSHTAFTAGVLDTLLAGMPADVEVVALSGTSGGAICAALAWDGLVRGDPGRARRNLGAFWSAMAASEPLDGLANQALQGLVMLRDWMVLPEVSPYTFPPWAQGRLRELLEPLLDCEALRAMAMAPGAPALHIGAVEVLTGHFDVFLGEELCLECLLASAAIPDLFPAVEVPGRGVYWDGLFSQNPPIHDLTDHDINELWVVQINPSTCARLPTATHEILDRRNELAGNISLEQELRQIAMVNRLIARGAITDPKYHPIHVDRIALGRDLDYGSKLDRSPAFLAELREHGRAQARWFLKERAANRFTLEALGVLTPAAGGAARSARAVRSR